MMETSLLVIILLSLIGTFPKEVDLAYVSDEAITNSTSYHVVQQWAEKLSYELYNLGDYITRRKQVQEKFEEVQVVSRFGQKIVEDMAKEIKDMMDWKVGTVQKIVEAAQNIAIYEDEKADTSFRYFNAKEMLEPHDKPYVPRKLEVDEKEPKITKPPPKIIELVSHPNFPGLPVNFTYSSVHVPTNVFDRSLGVIKAIQWSEQLDDVFRSNYRDDPTLSWQFFGSSYGFMRQYPASKWKEDPVDLYDCRLRQWYINGANSPKDIIILVDNSGSMTGETKDIAKHVASTILDTLGSNDFVNIFTFSDDIKDVVSCVGDSLVPATMGNLRELKLGLEKINTTEQANFTLILSKAFDILEEYRTNRHGAQCNQAIMLISDGVPYKHEEVFEEYNWQNLPYMPVRVFTYLIGREVDDVSQIKWMACENQGFYVHLSTTAEVREEVLNYLHVMARPLALKQDDHPITWTDVYADAEDPKMTDWLWRNKEFEMQKERFASMKNNSKIIVSNKKVHNHKYNEENYILMTTVSMPVFDLRENASRIAKLLGVAGTDVPVSDIKKLMRPFMLGVNGYSFIVTNNGYILTHPDLRPVFQKILKPAYNSVDMVEIEQMDDDSEPRAFNPVIMDIRDKIINQTTSSKWMIMKYHMDDMKRVSKLKRQYFWTGIKDTPFSLVITYPHEYGVNRIQIKNSEDEIPRLNVRGSSSVKYFQGDRWRVHPDWLYCKNHTVQFKSPEEELLHFLREISSSGWKWPVNRSRPPPEIYCDRGLLQSLVFDARVTEFFSNFSSREDRKMLEYKKRFGVTTAFIATHSGLTRWVEMNSNESNREFNFTESNARAIDEVWYKRAVDQHFIELDSFVYSVPFDSGSPNNTETLVTASHAIFHTDDGRSAPVAVVGFNFHHTALQKIFKNITSNCQEANCKTCESNELECYVLDNHGYVIIGSETGKFYGDVNNSVMHLLAEERVYKTVKIYDYQAVCFAGKNYSTRVNTAFNTLFFDFYNKVSINKTRPETCDQELTLYQLNTDKDTTIYITPASRERPFTVLPIKQSNMILLVVDVLNVIANQSIPVSTRPIDVNYEESLMCHKIFSAMPRKRPASCTNKHFNENSIEFCGQGFIATFSLALIMFAICFVQLCNGNFLY